MTESLPPSALEPGGKSDQLKRMITRSATPFAVALILGLACPAVAEITEPPLPQFSKTDIARIERNDTLRALYSSNPWLTYRVLRSIDAGAATNRDMLPGAQHQTAPVTAPHFDPGRDPDLDHLQRIAPEAAADLFALIKKASGINPPAKFLSSVVLADSFRHQHLIKGPRQARPSFPRISGFATHLLKARATSPFSIDADPGWLART